MYFSFQTSANIIKIDYLLYIVLESFHTFCSSFLAQISNPLYVSPTRDYRNVLYRKQQPAAYNPMHMQLYNYQYYILFKFSFPFLYGKTYYTVCVNSRIVLSACIPKTVIWLIHNLYLKSGQPQWSPLSSLICVFELHRNAITFECDCVVKK